MSDWFSSPLSRFCVRFSRRAITCTAIIVLGVAFLRPTGFVVLRDLSQTRWWKGSVTPNGLSLSCSFDKWFWPRKIHLSPLTTPDKIAEWEHRVDSDWDVSVLGFRLGLEDASQVRFGYLRISSYFPLSLCTIAWLTTAAYRRKRRSLEI